MTVLKPCPCGGTACFFCNWENGVQTPIVECLTCGLSLPSASSQDEAIAVWNNHPMHDIERLREVEKDGAELHNFMKKLWHRNSKLKYIIEEMFKICPCMCNVALDYECAKCEAKRILEGMKE